MKFNTDRLVKILSELKINYKTDEIWLKGKKKSYSDLKSISQGYTQFHRIKLCHLENNAGRHSFNPHLFPDTENLEIMCSGISLDPLEAVQYFHLIHAYVSPTPYTLIAFLN
jgi:hypothetical protein